LDEALKLCKEMELKGTVPYDGYYDLPGVNLSREHNDLLAYNRVASMVIDTDHPKKIDLWVPKDMANSSDHNHYPSYIFY